MIEQIAKRYQERRIRGYARRRLRADPVFDAAFEILEGSERPVLDLGCGIGLFAFYLRARGFRELFVGVDLDDRKIRHARAAGRGEAGLHFVFEKMAGTREFVGNVVVFDVLRWMNANDQHTLLQQVARQVAPGGVCIIRETPRDRSWRFVTTRIRGFFARFISWMKRGVRHYPSVEEISAPFLADGFEVEVRPLWGCSIFNSHLLVMRRPG